ncbi:MAG: hypothetical protein PUK70_03075 [Bacteroidales bacterium]|nr:hypothetical protein [Bacteroidales bacterium]MDY6002050.1 hypothetical protein [Candidatus Cryptobacteroides sp.]
MDRNERLDKRQADTSPYCIKVTIFSFIKTAEKAKYCLRCHQFPTICARYQKLVGIKNIHIGPTLPAFVSPELLQTLPSAFGLGTITTVDDDIKTMVG